MWANEAIQQLKLGNTVVVHPRGNSMRGMIRSGQACTLVPANSENVKLGSVVLCMVHGKQYLHLVNNINTTNGLYQISNNRGLVDGWVRINKIYGVLTRVE